MLEELVNNWVKSKACPFRQEIVPFGVFFGLADRPSLDII